MLNKVITYIYGCLVACYMVANNWMRCGLIFSVIIVFGGGSKLI